MNEPRKHQDLSEDERYFLDWFNGLNEWQRKAIIALAMIARRTSVKEIDCKALVNAFARAQERDNARNKPGQS